jgi:hypothetical protein
MNWQVIRQDDNGQLFVLAKNLSEGEANSLVSKMESRGHKQTFYMIKMPGEIGVT